MSKVTALVSADKPLIRIYGGDGEYTEIEFETQYDANAAVERLNEVLVLSLPHEQTERCQRWRRAAELLLDQADVPDVSRQVHLALFYDARLDIGAMKA